MNLIHYVSNVFFYFSLVMNTKENLRISSIILYRVASSYLDNGVDVLSVAGIQSTLPRPNSLPLEYTSGRHIQILFKPE